MPPLDRERPAASKRPAWRGRACGPIDQHGGLDMILNPRIFYLWIVSAASVLLLLGACSRAEPTGNDVQPPSKETAMTAHHETTEHRTALPPIDAAAPHVFETASFGLG